MPCFILVLMAASMLLPSLAAAAKVTYLKRPAEIKRKGTGDWNALRLGYKVNGGDAIRTGFGGRVEVTVSSRRVFRVGAVTELEIPELEETKKGGLRALFRLTLGRFWGGLIRPLKKLRGDKFQVSTATATIGVKGTQFGLDYDRKTKVSRLLVLEGEVAAVPPGDEDRLVEVEAPREIPGPQEITEEAWLLLVRRNQKIVIRPGEAPRVEPITDKDREDEWVRFNLERDRQLAQGQ
ncbi:MAG: FecR family protein [bacterium]